VTPVAMSSKLTLFHGSGDPSDEKS
jgi:hypothetical protein